VQPLIALLVSASTAAADLTMVEYSCDPRECRRGGGECYEGRCGPPVPISGTGLTIAGSIVAGASLIWFALGAIACAPQQDPAFPFAPMESVLSCAGPYLAIGGVSFAVGLPMLIAGIMKALQFDDWVARYHPPI
jgi:hypothetical protein